MRRQGACRIARVDFGLFDMFHNSGDKDLSRVVGDGIDIHFDCVLQKLIDEHRIITGNPEQLSRLQCASQHA